MQQADRLELRDEILNQINETKKSIRAMKDLVKPVPPDNAIGRLSRMEAIAERGVQRVSLESRQIKIRKLQHALIRINEGGFGNCGECGTEIPMARLRLLPEIQDCVDCLAEESA